MRRVRNACSCFSLDLTEKAARSKLQRKLNVMSVRSRRAGETVVANFAAKWMHSIYWG
jgi:superfamily II RNA helicase